MNFERPERKTERLDRGGYFERKISELAPELKQEAEKLGKLGFELDENCRIKPEAFMGKIPTKELAADLQKVRELSSKFKNEAAADPKKKAEKSTGEALEMAKTIGVNGRWFGGRFLAVRSSAYDDMCGNKVDNLIFDSETLEPLAAIDATTDQAAKMPAQKEIFKKILEGAEVKYGYKLEKTEQAPGYRAVKSPNMKLPYFIISFGAEELENIARDLVSGSGEEELGESSRKMIANLKNQAGSFSQHPKMTPEMKSAYERFIKIFESVGETGK